MNVPEKVDHYIRMARIAGTEVECVDRSGLLGRLASVLDGQTKIAALSASGWPEGLRESVESFLASRGFQVTMPRKEQEGFVWDLDLLARASVGIVWCDRYLAETGSLVLSSGPGAGGLATLLPEISIVLSDTHGCLEGLADYLEQAGAMPPARMTLVTGPSCTGDIEATMTRGVHGPAKVVHFIML